MHGANGCAACSAGISSCSWSSWRGRRFFCCPRSGKETAAEQTAEQTSLLQSVDALERRLEAALSRMDGAGEVTVVLTVKSSGRQILAQDGKTTERGETTDTQLTTVVVSRGSGSEEPVALQQLSPQYQGALVVCSGGDADAVRLKIVEAVSALTGLGADKISVCKGK